MRQNIVTNCDFSKENFVSILTNCDFPKKSLCVFQIIRFNIFGTYLVDFGSNGKSLANCLNSDESLPYKYVLEYQCS